MCSTHCVSNDKDLLVCTVLCKYCHRLLFSGSKSLVTTEKHCVLLLSSVP